MALVLETWTEAQKAGLARREQLRRHYVALGECLVLVEAQRRRFSKNECDREPKPGYEKAYDGETVRLQAIREVMEEIRAEDDQIVKRLYQD